MTDLNLFEPNKNQANSFAKEYYEETSFKNITQSEIVLKEKEFYKCTFINVAMNFSKLFDCRFEECKFVGCDFSLSKFHICSFIDVEFVECKLVGIDWTGISKPFQASFDKCKINDSIFFNVDLRSKSITSCEAHNVDFEKANLSKGDLSNSDLLGAKFNGSNLSHADFSGAFNYLIDPTNCNIKKAKFSLPQAMSLLSYLDIRIE